MATRNALRLVSRRFSSGKVLGKEEQAAENVYIKKMEQEKLEKLARKGPTAEERPTASSGGSDSVTDSKPGAQGSSSTFGVSTDIYRNYGVLAGFITGVGALGWYWMSRDSKKEEIIE